LLNGDYRAGQPVADRLAVWMLITCQVMHDRTPMHLPLTAPVTVGHLHRDIPPPPFPDADPFNVRKSKIMFIIVMVCFDNK